MSSCDTADARQRIVSERVDMIDNVIISVSVILTELPYFEQSIFLFLFER